MKSEFLDYVYLQQNTFDEVDAANGADRQRNTFALVQSVLKKEFSFTDKDDARRYFLELRQLCMDLNYLREDSAEYKENFEAIVAALVKAKPATAKGTYLVSCTLSATMTPGLKINLKELVKAAK